MELFIASEEGKFEHVGEALASGVFGLAVCFLPSFRPVIVDDVEMPFVDVDVVVF